ncbi:DEKNAAC102226 [Brettanomyces naardenensis]|uniref:DEKNAAC102226 n=1 Tax=Brettanomyces naardenensis TaxID=13370 RepID=A0A448YL40_BRENA|nr:DEKNAAC102226 [Brettanomyces naardenensis]
MIATRTKQLQSVISSIQKLYPISYADNTWDNTGLLVDSSTSEYLDAVSPQFRILLTVDLTQSVADEAIAKRSNLILAYHPFIFRGLKAIVPSDPQQKSLIKLIQSGISVYCPHTAIDAAEGGVNDWLAEGISNGGLNIASKRVIEPNSEVGNVGMGRFLELKDAISLQDAINLVKKDLKLEHVQVATNGFGRKDEKSITTVAICAGSGGGVFKNVKADLYYTGELSHHEALYYKECGSHVIVCNHSNTERGFLHRLKEQLSEEFIKGGLLSVEMLISQEDRDPYKIV